MVKFDLILAVGAICGTFGFARVSMQQHEESYFSPIVKFITDKAKVTFDYCKNAAEPHIGKAVQRAQPFLEKGKVFYHEHQKAILVASTAMFVYLLFGGKKKKEDDKPKKKKVAVNKVQVNNKVFVSDDSVEEYKEEPSTTIRVESSGKEGGAKKRVTERVLERIQSSSEQQETGDKIFFEMYKKYQNS